MTAAAIPESQARVSAVVAARFPMLAAILRPFAQRAQLHYVLFLALTMIATVPVGILAVWVEKSAYQKELASVHEQHLMIARNLSHTLALYAKDVEAVFTATTAQMVAGIADANMTPLLAALHFEHVCILGADGKIDGVVAGLSSGKGRRLTADKNTLRALAGPSDRGVVFTGVLADANGIPTMYVLKDLGDGRYAIGTLSTDYFTELQKAIAFGERGHAAIVDQNGRVIAHPKAEWRQEMKDLSKVYAVQQMKSGETGVATFFSPAMKADMIAGYTTVPGVNWGVMVPQPLGELAVRARDVEALAVRITAVGLMIATILAWMLARHIAGPIERVAQAAREVADGHLDTRVTGLSRALPMEIDAMATSFNHMVSQLSLKTAELEATAIRAESANRAKTQFMANMSHEFRTPLNAIIGFSEVMRDRIFGPLGNDRYASYVGDIHQSASHLGAMIKEILDLTKAEQGKMELDNGPVVLDDIVDMTVRMVNQRAEAKHLSLTTDIESMLPTLSTDAVKLRQILLNLVSNAVKFTPPNGTIAIRGTMAGDSVVLSVSDTGIGISEKDLPKVMEPFGQVANAFSRNHEGTGLGLPLTKELVDVLGGRMRLESEVGIGTTVTVWLPIKATAASAVSLAA